MSSILLRQCKYVVKEKKMMSTFVTDDIEISSNDSDKEKCDEKNSDEGNSIEEN